MKVAFVGKGGSGKTTLSAAYLSFLKENSDTRVLAVDADINMHLASLLGFRNPAEELWMANKDNTRAIKEYLAGSNEYPSMDHFRKTTPPTASSNIINIGKLPAPLQKLSQTSANTTFLAVGTYTAQALGNACYHNHLAVFENVLSHMNDSQGYLVADMLAGTDAFANTLFMQFDRLVLCVEPTRRSIEVYQTYQKIAQEANIENSLLVIGNSIMTSEDKDFLKDSISLKHLVGYFLQDPHLQALDKSPGALNYTELLPTNQNTLQTLHKFIEQTKTDYQKRTQELWQLHKEYTQNDYIRERFGDLSKQIDPNFYIATPPND